MASDNARPPSPGPQPYGARNTLLIGTGALSVSLLPFWLNWIRELHPETTVRTVLTRGARRFVSPEALAALNPGGVLLDEWGGPRGESRKQAPHVAWSEWADAVLVYPATAHFLARHALGLPETPSLLTLQCFSGPIGLAPSLPPGSLDSPAVQEHLRALARLRNVVLAPCESARSATTGKVGNGAAAPLPELMYLVEGLRNRIGLRGRHESGEPADAA
ncbi:phosphopantothenoylcysteine decarboxylase [Nocardiopsis sp. CNT-189]|uniref:flavoprotein n=1 Tax=Nocardiopsis oceanisediminis TaxID=2816862 RepID=UPI003B2AE496